MVAVTCGLKAANGVSHRFRRAPSLKRSFAMAALLGTVLATFPAVPALAGNQVQPSEDLVEVRSDLIRLIAPSRLGGEAERLVGFAGEVLPRLQADLRQDLRAPTTLVLIDRTPHPDLVSLDSAAAPWAAGYLFGGGRIGGIRLHRTTAYPFDSTEMVLVHELTHQLLYDKVGPSLPTWFDEGVATMEGRRRGARDLVVFASLTSFGRIPRLESLDLGFRGRSPAGARLAYATSFEFLSWAVREHGPDLVGEVLDATERRLAQRPLPLDARTPFEAAWQDVTGQPLLVDEERWRDRGLRLTRWIPLLINTPWLWIGMAILAVAAALARRRRTREQYERWEAEELAAASRVTALTAGSGGTNSEEDQEPPVVH